MTFIYATLVLLAGLLAGLLINVVATRLHANRPLLGRLRCTRAGHTLAAWQAIPVAGYAVQRGRCSTCGRALGLSYPLVELAAGLLFLAIYLLEGWSIAFLFHCAYAVVLLLVLVLDWKHRDIYISIIAAGSVVALAGSVLLPEASILGALIAAAVAGGFFLAAFLLAKLIFPHIQEPLGSGDVLLALMMGLMLGFPNIVGALLIGPLIAGAAALLLLISGHSKLGDFMPYGVALCAASILFLVYPSPFAGALNLPALANVLSGALGK